MKLRNAWMAGLGIIGLTVAATVTSSAVADQRGTDSGRDAARPALKVGDKAPDFTLKDLDGKDWKLSDLNKDGKIVVLEWFNPGCPYVVKHHANGQATMRDMAKAYKDRGVVWLAVNSTNERHKDFEKTRPMVKQWGIEYPVLLDASGDVGRSFGAKTTPHMFIIDKEGVLRYQGAIDSHRVGRPPADDEKAGITNYVSQALDEVLAGETVTTSETESYGCGVKYAN